MVICFLDFKLSFAVTHKSYHMPFITTITDFIQQQANRSILNNRKDEYLSEALSSTIFLSFDTKHKLPLGTTPEGVFLLNLFCLYLTSHCKSG